MSSKRDVWLTEYDALAQQGVSIKEKINERNRAKVNGGNPSKLNSSIRLMLNGFARDLTKLKTALSKATTSYHITEGEAIRRQTLVDNLTVKQRQLNDAFKDEPSESKGSNRDRDTLLSTQPFGVPTNPWMDDEPEETQGLTNNELLQQHQQIMRQQDEGLDELANALQRQKHIGWAMHDEVENQDEIIDDLSDKVGRTTARIERETRHVEKIRVKASDKGLCCFVTLLFLLIVILMIIPKH